MIGHERERADMSDCAMTLLGENGSLVKGFNCLAGRLAFSSFWPARGDARPQAYRRHAYASPKSQPPGPATSPRHLPRLADEASRKCSV